MLNELDLNEMHHEDPLQQELALTFARALHSHTCVACGMLRVCTVVACEFRPDDRRVMRTLAGTVMPVVTERYECYLCRDAMDSREAMLERSATDVESSRDEVGGGDDEA